MVEYGVMYKNIEHIYKTQLLVSLGTGWSTLSKPSQDYCSLIFVDRMPALGTS